MVFMSRSKGVAMSRCRCQELRSEFVEEDRRPVVLRILLVAKLDMPAQVIEERGLVSTWHGDFGGIITLHEIRDGYLEKEIRADAVGFVKCEVEGELEIVVAVPIWAVNRVLKQYASGVDVIANGPHFASLFGNSSRL